MVIRSIQTTAWEHAKTLLAHFSVPAPQATGLYDDLKPGEFLLHNENTVLFKTSRKKKKGNKRV